MWMMVEGEVAALEDSKVGYGQVVTSHEVVRVGRDVEDDGTDGRE